MEAKHSFPLMNSSLRLGLVDAQVEALDMAQTETMFDPSRLDGREFLYQARTEGEIGINRSP